MWVAKGEVHSERFRIYFRTITNWYCWKALRESIDDISRMVGVILAVATSLHYRNGGTGAWQGGYEFLLLQFRNDGRQLHNGVKEAACNKRPRPCCRCCQFISMSFLVSSSLPWIDGETPALRQTCPCRRGWIWSGSRVCDWNYSRMHDGWVNIGRVRSVCFRSTVYMGR